MSQSIPAALSQAAWTAIGSVPGCVMDHLTFTGPIPTAQNRRLHTVGVSGWSPSLHALDHEWLFEIDTGPDRTPAVQRRDMIARLRPLIAEQRRRAAAGLALNIATPLRVDGNSAELAHLHCDASLAGIIVKRAAEEGMTPDAALRRHIGKHLIATHREVIDHRGGPRLGAAQCSVEERHDIRMVEVRRVITNDASGQPIQVVMTGSDLVITGTALPDTVANGSAGLRLGALAAIDPLLDDRTIAQVVAETDSITIHLEPVLVKLGDLIRIGADEAVGSVGELIAANRRGRQRRRTDRGQ